MASADFGDYLTLSLLHTDRINGAQSSHSVPLLPK